MAMVEHLGNFAKILEEFFKGLSECGLMSNYIIQLQSNVSDINLEIISKFRCLIECAIKQLQNLLSNTVGSKSNPENTQPVSDTGAFLKGSSSSVQDLKDSNLISLSPQRCNAVKYDHIARKPSNATKFHKQTNFSSMLKPVTVAKEDNFVKLHTVEELKVDRVIQIIVEAADVEPNSICISVDNKRQLETPEYELKDAAVGEHVKTLAERKHHSNISASPSSTRLENTRTCDICKKEFPCTVSLQEHFRQLHAGVGCFPCETCGKRMTTKMSLVRHRNTHGGGQPAICKFCGKAFSRADYLQTHYAYHFGKRKFACSRCPSKFNCSAQLKIHEKIHTGVKEHVCNECGKGFMRKDKLKEHVLRHLKVKRFTCHVCQKQYAEARDLKKHLKSHSPS